MQKQIHTVNIIQKLERIKKEIDSTINEVKRFNEDDERPRCFRCGWRNIRIRMDKSYFCNSCGYESRTKKEQKR